MSKEFKFPNLIKKETALFQFLDGNVDKKHISTRFATLSMIYVLVAMCGTAFLFLFPVFTSFNFLILEIFLIFLVGIIGIILPCFFLMKAFTCLYYQFKLNKQKAVWLALIVNIVAVAAICVFVTFTSILL